MVADAVASLTRIPEKNGSCDLALLQLRACHVKATLLHVIVHTTFGTRARRTNEAI